MSSQCFGQIVEAEKDAAMVRTRNRPVPRGAIGPQASCFIGTGLSVASFMAYSTFAPYTWLISNAIWFSYLCVYIPMKQSSPWNTFVGAIVGSLPPLIGTMAQTGGLMSVETALLAGYIFSWQFPHFYGILYENKDDYKRAGFKMLSNEDPHGERASRHIAACTVVNSLLPLGMLSTGMISPVFLAPFYYYQVQYVQAVKEFKEQGASVQSAKKLKKKAYMPFIVLLAGFMLSTAHSRHKKRKETQEA
jgi:protoheme IX farnesyltransferase